MPEVYVSGKLATIRDLTKKHPLKKGCLQVGLSRVITEKPFQFLRCRGGS